MEEELGRLLEERTRLNEEIKNLEHRFISLADVSEREAVADQIDGCQQKIRYVMDQITETQTAITDMDGGKMGIDFALTSSIRFLGKCFPERSRTW
ncbi:unnamed protein product [Haemonchus placei]|uniref:KIF21A/B second helical domain-containing protein n=1 Tax=Haemonchus placei TaxID=6290 RepID=A0A0N4WXQ5_HAEPC|nr:unnamed protein product [Haemonchus placei]